MTLPSIPRAALEFLIAIFGWATDGFREVVHMWIEGKAIERWTWSVNCE